MNSKMEDNNTLRMGLSVMGIVLVSLFVGSVITRDTPSMWYVTITMFCFLGGFFSLGWWVGRSSYPYESKPNVVAPVPRRPVFSTNGDEE